MMWLIAFSAQPYYGIWGKGLRVSVNRESYTPFTLDWLGIVGGNFWDYRITGILWGNGTERDSVFLVGTISTVGTCVFSSLPGANYQIDRTTDSASGTTVDTGFIYFRSGYDNLYGDGGVMIMKYMATASENWQAWDTCLIPLNTKFPIGDVDGDMIVDSVWVRSSTTRVSSVIVDTFITAISPLKYVVWASYLSSAYGIDSITLWDYYRYKFVANFGKIEEHLDSERAVYYMGSFPALDTTFRNMYHKIIVSTGIHEKPEIQVSKHSAIYDVSGRFSKVIPTRKGVYFVITDRGRVRKVIVK